MSNGVQTVRTLTYGIIDTAVGVLTITFKVLNRVHLQIYVRQRM